MSVMTPGRDAGQRSGARHFIYKTGLCEGTHVMTVEGHLPVEYLATGDRVVTRAGSSIIRHISTRRLKDCPILVKRGTFGPGKPMQDTYLAPDQNVHLRAWRSRTYYGSDQIAVPVSRLTDGDNILWGEHPGELNVYELELEGTEVIYAEGLEVMSAALPENVIRFVAA
ncbi:MAG: Hint domain-containing protein [Paracoccaceae bacterium]